ncbi:DUF4041 domain-containing protein [Clostridium sardiniense]|uniref:DUF4041 domain-containing protein n=1 Tax=Clostridium sardiniense TaxID=29369 RepID=A0ABS7KWF7_CLOSR|nr:DUF4041 domain-containing protein [Clostridium sardiniense]MBY0755007.1 DUF4041 domain-containing protein [Clostridium sardiniense]MDQ0459139.1 hypothetical protein [Clostridium sardiniense]
MNTKYKALIIIAIIIGVISAVVPLAGFVTVLIMIIMYNELKEDDKAILSRKEKESISSNLDSKIKEKESELKEIKDKVKLEHIKIDELKNQNSTLEDIVNFNNVRDTLQLKIESSKEELKHINEKISMSNEILDYNELEKELYTFQVGIFEKKYEYELSEEYNFQLKVNKDNQREIIRNGLAITIKNVDYIWNYSMNKSEKNRAVNNLCKLALRAFNNESDLVINKLTISNMVNSRKKLENAMVQINKLIDCYNISITSEFFKLKIEELQLQYEYLVKIQEEREEQREIKEQMREEAKVQAEIVKLEKEAQKEEKLYQRALEKVRVEFNKANHEEKEKLEMQIKTLEENLKIAEEKMQRAKSMAQQTRSGYVYVISNVGSFGEDVYKIGLTRRLEPMNRIKELSDASVPFKFDVHAMIYSDDAPALEKELHNKFNSNRLNKVNLRKEFFKVSLSDIEKVVNNKLNGDIRFTKMAEALEYRQSLKM